MLINELSYAAIPALQYTDTVAYALQLMQEHAVNTLAVTGSDGKFAGLIAEDFLLAQDDGELLHTFEYQLTNLSIQPKEHFLQAAAMAGKHHLAVIPVAEDGIFLGYITQAAIIAATAQMMSLEQPGALLVLECEPNEYSFSEISRIVENNDARLTQYNTYTVAHTGMVRVTLRTNKLEVSDLVAAFQRYDYNVLYYFGDELYANEIKTNYENLMNYLNV